MVVGFDYTIDGDSGVAKTSMDTLPLGHRSITLETQTENPVRENCPGPFVSALLSEGPEWLPFFQNTEH